MLIIKSKQKDQGLSIDKARRMIQEIWFFDSILNPLGRGSVIGLGRIGQGLLGQNR